MKQWIILLLTIAVVILGVFLPEYLLSRNPEPEIRKDYQQVSVSSQTSSDYVWRMQQLGEHYFGEGEHQTITYITEVRPDDDDTGAYALFTNELNKLIAAGAIPVDVGRALEKEPLNMGPSYLIRYYYLFDSEAVSGFRFAEFVVSGKLWNVALCMDVESGKLARVQYGGSQLIPDGNASPVGSSGWYDMLRSYADYLDLSAVSLSRIPQLPLQNVRQYYETCTADRLAATLAFNENAWLELRALKENYRLTLAVYNGGK